MTQEATTQALERRQTGTDIMRSKQNSIAKVDMRELKELAEIFVASGAFSDIKQVAQAQIKILAGNELGFSPLVSMTGIHFFQGKVTIGSNLIASLIKESPKYDYEIVEHSSTACAVQFYENGMPIGVPVRYTLADAQEAGLLSKDTWKKYPADLLFAAVIRQGARRYCADVLRGTTASTDTAGDHEYDDTPFVEGPVESIEQLLIDGETVDTSTGEVIDAEPVAETETGRLRSSILSLCSDLNATGLDSIKWANKTLNEYIGEMFDTNLETSNEKQLATVERDLKERLAAIQKAAKQ